MAINEIPPEEQDYIVRNQKEIQQIIQSLKTDAASLKIAFNQGNEDYFTQIIDIDKENGVMYFDMTIDAAFNKRLLAAPELIILKDTGIRIRWKSVEHSVITLPDGNALRTEIPNALVRLQRRELFRLKTPVIDPIPCEMSVPNSNNPTLKEAIKYNLVDVSLGGVGLIIDETLHPALKVGAIIDPCIINFPDAGETQLKLEVRNIISLEENDTQKYRVGLGFVRPNRSTEGIIHKYTFNLERKMLAAKKQY